MSILEGKVAVVTGPGRGIGKGCALHFARQGARVIGCELNPETAAETEAEARAEGLDLKVVGGINLTLPEDVKRFVDELKPETDAVHALINAAAVQPHMTTIADMDYDAHWTPTIVGEVDIVVLMVREIWPLLEAAGGASIVNFSSFSAKRASLIFGMGPHCAGKAAVEAVTRQIAVEGGPKGIRANTIAPGMIETPATNAAGALDGATRERLLSRLSIKRLGRPEDIANCAAFLCSDAAQYITGANVPVDGGATAV